MSASVNRIVSIRAVEEKRRGYIKIAGYKFVLGSSIIDLLDQINSFNKQLDKVKLKAQYASERTLPKGITFKSAIEINLVTAELEETSVMLIESTPLNQIKSIIIYKNSLFNMLEDFNYSFLEPFKKDSSDYRYELAVDGVQLKFKEYDDCYSITIIKAPATIQNLDLQSQEIETEPLTQSRTTVMEATRIMMETMSELASTYERVRPKTSEEKVEYAKTYKENLLNEIKQDSETLIYCKEELKEINLEYSDWELAYKKHKTEMFLQSRKGNITEDNKVSAHISRGSRSTGIRYQTSVEALYPSSREAWKRIDEISSPFGNNTIPFSDVNVDFRPGDGGPPRVTYHEAVPYDEWNSNPKYFKLQELVEDFEEAKSVYSRLKKRKVELEKAIIDLAENIEACRLMLQKIQKVYNL